MAKRKKKLKGIVKSYFKTGGVEYFPNREFTTYSKDLYDYLINNKKIK